MRRAWLHEHIELHFLKFLSRCFVALHYVYCPVSRAKCLKVELALLFKNNFEISDF